LDDVGYGNKDLFMNLFNKLLRHELIIGIFYIFLGSMVANVMAFLLNLFFARNLSLTDYGIFASLLSIITLAVIIGNSITTIIVKYSTTFYTNNDNAKLKSFYKQSAWFVVGFSIFIFLFFLLISPLLSSFLHIDNYFYLILAGLAVAAFYLQTLNLAFLQGLMKFGFISIVNALGSTIKLLVGVLFVYLGFRAFSGLWAVLFMGLGAFLVGFIPLKKVLSQKTEVSIALSFKDISGFALPAFITVLFMTSFTSTDVLLVKHFFNPQLAAFYAGLSLIGKVIFYFTAPISAVMFPLLVKRYATGKSFINIFYLSLLLVLLPSLLISTFYFVFPNFIIKLLLGGREYYYIVPYLGIFGIYLTIFSLVNVCVNFFLSLGKTIITYPVVVASLTQVILICIFHADFYQVIGISLIVSLILLLILLVAFFITFGNLDKLKESIALLDNQQI
jgi:O-antigen/teichoic acid export membrane protein